MGILTPPSPLGAAHQLDDFDCGNATLNEWLRRQARRNEASGASRTFVVCDAAGSVVGYYCLAAGAVSREDSPGAVRRNMPEPVPVMVLGRLAVDRRWQSRQVGKGMLKDAVQRTLAVSSQVGVRALLVHAISPAAKAFYLEHGFRESPSNPMLLMITLSEAATTIR